MDFINIDDIIDSRMKLLYVNNADGKIIKIGDIRKIRVNDFFGRLKTIIGSSSKIQYCKNQKGDLKHTLADIGLANKLIGYLPSVSIEQGLS